MKKILGCLFLIMFLVVVGCLFGGNYKLLLKKLEELK